ncbi:hypothetical protein RI543_000717 [Arxiozyma heterogenica]|uniref:Rad61 Wapl domain-containing protein n=1 Tax=Arxiozyma heterogenica TaxID=278026 RepID=A0AAN7ZYV4_9SACH|nr:hypothetical protein RI543_000717 [Kazachstania heterogenica]
MSDIIPNFIFKKNPKKIRKTYIKKQHNLDNGENDINNEDKDSKNELYNQNSFIETKVYQFMAQLHSKNVINNNLLMEEIHHALVTSKSPNLPFNISKHYYNNKRTMLVNCTENDWNEDDVKISMPSNKKNYMVPDNDLVDDDTTLVMSEVSLNNKNNKNGKKRFFGKNHQITRMKSNLKYQHDYDFLINNDLPLYSKLLNLINIICDEDDMSNDENINNDSFKQYFLKWKLQEFFSYCSNHKDIKISKTRFFMMFLLIKLNLSMDESPSLITFLIKLIPLSINDTFSIHCIDNVSKLTRITLKSFLKFHNLEKVTNHHLAIKLWSFYSHQLPQLIPYIQSLNLNLDNREDDIAIHSKYKTNNCIFISNIIIQFGQLIMDDTDLNYFLLNLFINHWIVILYDKISIMAFIILTNNKYLFLKLNATKINEIVSKIVSMRYKCLNETDNDDIIQLQICQFALCLNIIELINKDIQIDEWDLIINKVVEKHINNKDSSNFNIEEKNNDREYLLGLFILILLLIEYYSQNRKYKITHFDNKNKLIIILKKFKLLTSDNIKIIENIDLIVENFK